MVCIKKTLIHVKYGEGQAWRLSGCRNVVKARDGGALTHRSGSGDGKNVLERGGEGGENWFWYLIGCGYEGKGGVEI